MISILGVYDLMELMMSCLSAFKFGRSPFVSFLYERGWRQNFNRSGFPGPDEEVCFLKH